MRIGLKICHDRPQFEICMWGQSVFYRSSLFLEGRQIGSTDTRNSLVCFEVSRHLAKAFRASSCQRLLSLATDLYPVAHSFWDCVVASAVGTCPGKSAFSPRYKCLISGVAGARFRTDRTIRYLKKHLSYGIFFPTQCISSCSSVVWSIRDKIK